MGSHGLSRGNNHSLDLSKWFLFESELIHRISSPDICSLLDSQIDLSLFPFPKNLLIGTELLPVSYHGRVFFPLLTHFRCFSLREGGGNPCELCLPYREGKGEVLRVEGSIFLQRDSNVFVISEESLLLLPKLCCLLAEKPNQAWHSSSLVSHCLSV